MRIVNELGGTALQHDGIDYVAGADAVFDVPESVGEQMVRFNHFVREHEAVDHARAARARDEVDPSSLASRVRELEALINAQQRPSASEAELLARVAELEAQNAKLQDSASADEADAEADEHPAKAAAKKTAAKKAATAKATSNE
jgi:uncharacterized coiled-coil DUF342 family protein